MEIYCTIYFFYILAKVLLKSFGTYKAWNDNTLENNCYWYRYPDLFGNYQYTDMEGGNGIYKV